MSFFKVWFFWTMLSWENGLWMFVNICFVKRYSISDLASASRDPVGHNLLVKTVSLLWWLAWSLFNCLPLQLFCVSVKHLSSKTMHASQTTAQIITGQWLSSLFIATNPCALPLSKEYSLFRYSHPACCCNDRRINRSILVYTCHSSILNSVNCAGFTLSK